MTGSLAVHSLILAASAEVEDSWFSTRTKSSGTWSFEMETGRGRRLRASALQRCLPAL